MILLYLSKLYMTDCACLHVLQMLNSEAQFIYRCAIVCINILFLTSDWLAIDQN